MNNTVVTQVVRPTLFAATKRFVSRAIFTRTFACQGTKYQLEKDTHHQSAPLTDSTLYTAQVNTTMETPVESTGATVQSESTFAPSVNAVFDE